MREFGKPIDNMEPTRVVVNYDFPHQPVAGELHYSDAIIRDGLHCAVGEEGKETWKALGWRGEQVYSEGILARETTVYGGIHTKLPLNYVRNSKWANYDYTQGHFEVKREDVGTYLFIGQATHDATKGNLIIMKNGEIMALSSTTNEGLSTQVVYATEPLVLGDVVALYFMTTDEEATVYNDFYNTRLIGVKVQ